MKRRALLALALAAALPAGAQRRMPKIGYLLLVPLSDPPSRDRKAFLDGLREHGYIPGKNIEIVYRSAQGEETFLPDMCEELLAEKVDVVAVSGAIAALAAKKAMRGVPVVMQAVGDPEGIGLVRSLSRPEANVTGVSFISSELAPKRIQLVRDLLPGAKRMAVVWDVRNPNAVAETAATFEAAKRVGMRTDAHGVASDAALNKALAKIATERPDAMYVAVEAGLVANNRTHLARYALERRIALVSGWSFLTEAGALMSYAPDIPAMFRRSASYVARILKGAKPADLPVEQATTVELVINLKTARAIGLDIPHSFLVRADRVIG